MTDIAPATQQNLSEFYIQNALQNANLMNAALALHDNRLHEAEPILKAHLKAHPLDVAAIRMLAELAARIGRVRDAENLLVRALEIAPEFVGARANLATILHRQNRPAEALATLEPLAVYAPDEIGHANLKAAVLNRIGDFDEALGLYEKVLAEAPHQPKVWMSYAHVLKTIGRTDEAITAYHRALDIAPWLGEVWWSLANLKTVKFSSDDVAKMQTALKRDDLKIEDRFHLDFALGKAFEDAKDFEQSFGHYDRANSLRKSQLDYKAETTTAMVDRFIDAFTPELMAHHTSHGHDAPDPIFVVSMPRSGSTLIEQILSSHSLVEGTSELADIPNLMKPYLANPKSLFDLSPEKIKSLGETYMERTRIQRKTDKPFFIDKLPNNWAYCAFIKLILPKAKIIDARRHPLACCFSNFKQHFAKGQAFSYSLEDMGHYYSDYVRLMAHYDHILSGQIHRVIYEDMVANSEAEIGKLLAACGLDFEDSCLRFYENDRAVRTPSSEQVRRPINDEGTKAWIGFAPWLEPLKLALGETLTTYPLAPTKF